MKIIKEFIKSLISVFAWMATIAILVLIILGILYLAKVSLVAGIILGIIFAGVQLALVDVLFKHYGLFDETY